MSDLILIIIVVFILYVFFTGTIEIQFKNYTKNIHYKFSSNKGKGKYKKTEIKKTKDK